jgi:hypothetical protein
MGELLLEQFDKTVMGHMVLVVRSFFSSLISGTITLVFQGEGKTPLRTQ